MNLYVIRHGQTDMNKMGLTQGRHGLPLNEVGLSQAHETADKLKGVKFDYIYSSPETRAIQTAEIVTGVEPIIDDRINVYDVGSATGIPRKDLIMVDGIIDSNFYQGVEKLDDYFDRVYGFMDYILDTYKGDENILLSCHECTTGCIHTYFHGKSREPGFLKYYQKNCEVREYIVDNSQSNSIAPIDAQTI